jgi:hypothetical protein
VQRTHNEKRAEQLLREGLEVAALSSDELDEVPGADPRKVALARLIWEQTTVSQEWLAERLRMGSAANVSPADPPASREAACKSAAMD